jgi:putative hemolysin
MGLLLGPNVAGYNQGAVMEKIKQLKALPETVGPVPSEEFPNYRSAIPQAEIREGRYRVRFARSRQEIEAALTLRFEVFNLELGEGLPSSFASGHDEDEFDESCHHLLVFDKGKQRLVGTYRVQVAEIASTARGFYSAGEFDLSRLPRGVLENSVELGRACIAKDHRNTQVLFLLWKGIASYIAYHRKRYLFGCCSLTGQDVSEGTTAYNFLQRKGHVHENFRVSPKPGFNCGSQERSVGRVPEVKLPTLFKIYLRFGAKVCGPPAIDRQFNTIDFFVLFDVDSMDWKTHRLFFGA